MLFSISSQCLVRLQLAGLLHVDVGREDRGGDHAGAEDVDPDAIGALLAVDRLAEVVQGREVP